MGLGVFVALVVAGVTGVVALAMFAVSGGPRRRPPRALPWCRRRSRRSPTKPSLPDDSARRCGAFLTAYEKKFGTLEAYEVGFFPQRVGVQVPGARVTRPRMERWTWDGAWRQDTTASAVRGPASASTPARSTYAGCSPTSPSPERSLDVEKGRFTHALLMRWNDEPTELNIYVGNEFNESGYLSTTPAGEVRRRHPYVP